MYIPIDRKVTYKNDIFLERALPNSGYLTAQIGEQVKPFSKLGMTKVSYQRTILGPSFKPWKGKKVGSFFYQGEPIGHLRFEKVLADYNGYLLKEGDDYIFKQEERDYWLLSGVWGEVVNVQKNTSVLVKTQAIDLKFAMSTYHNFSGELIVFPNPSDTLITEYLDNLSKNLHGKIVYVGENLCDVALRKAVALGVKGIITGGTQAESYKYAKENDVFIGLFTGFGDVCVTPSVYEVLKGVSNRFVFIDGEQRVLRIPAPEKFEATLIKEGNKTLLKSVKSGMGVMTLQKPYFGRIGTVDRVKEFSILVRFPDKEESVEIFIPNLLLLG